MSSCCSGCRFHCVVTKTSTGRTNLVKVKCSSSVHKCKQANWEGNYWHVGPQSHRPRVGCWRFLEVAVKSNADTSRRPHEGKRSNLWQLATVKLFFFVLGANRLPSTPVVSRQVCALHAKHSDWPHSSDCQQPPATSCQPVTEHTVFHRKRWLPGGKLLVSKPAALGL